MDDSRFAGDSTDTVRGHEMYCRNEDMTALIEISTSICP